MNKKRDQNRLTKIGERIRYVRENIAKISQDKLVSNCDVTKGNLSMIENGRKDFTITTLLEIAKGMEVHPKRLLDFDFEE